MQDFLVLSPSHTPSAALTYAAGLAKRCDASVTGLYVSEPITMLVGTALPAAASIVATWARERLARAREAAADFDRWAHQIGLARMAWRVAQGPLPEAVAYAGNWHDVLIVERDDNALWGTVNAIGQLLLSCGLPIVTLPHAYEKSAALDCIAVAWNGSPESTRALHASLPWLRRAARVVLLRGQRRPPFSPLIEAPAFDPGEYLENHAIRFEFGLLERPDEQSGEEILERSAALRADLLVMGGYGRNRYSEWVLGGATRHVLREARIPVLLRH